MRRPRLYSLGYEGLSVDQLVELLRGRVATVVDVRLTPSSRRRGFSKSRLAATLADAGISYVHEPTACGGTEAGAAGSTLTVVSGCPGFDPV